MLWLISFLTSQISDTNIMKEHLLENAAHMRLMFMGIILLLTLSFIVAIMKYRELLEKIKLIDALKRLNKISH